MAKTDDLMNRTIRLLAGRGVSQEPKDDMDEIDRKYRVDLMYESERRLYEEWRRGPGMKSDADVNAWIRREAGRA